MEENDKLVEAGGGGVVGIGDALLCNISKMGPILVLSYSEKSVMLDTSERKLGEERT